MGRVLGAQHTCHHERFAPRRKTAAVAAYFVNPYFWGARRCPGRHPYYSRAGTCPGELGRSEEHTSELQSRLHLVCRLLLEKKKRHHSYATWTVICCSLLCHTLYLLYVLYA